MVDSLLNRRKPRSNDPAADDAPPPPEPLRRRTPNHLVRTILLGSVAVAFAIYGLGRSYEVEFAEILGYLLTSVLFIGAFIAAAALLWVLFRLLPSLLKRRLRR